MPLDEEKKKLWKSILDKSRIVKNKEDEPPPDLRSQIDKVYEQLDIDKQYEDGRKEKGDPPEEKPLC